MDEQAARNEEERERYYSETYEKVLERLDTLVTNQESILNTLTEHEKVYQNLDMKIDDTKAASETAHAEILQRLERIESKLD